MQINDNVTAMKDSIYLSDEFCLAHLHFLMISKDRLLLPLYKGSTIRGALGYAMKKLACPEPNTQCETCSDKMDCIYSVTFETPSNSLLPNRSHDPNAPHPFVLRPPRFLNHEVPPDTYFTVDLILIHNHERLLDYFIASFDLLSQTGIGKGQGRFELVQVTDALNENKPLYTSQTKMILEHPKLLSYSQIPCPETVNKIRIKIETPLRAKVNKKWIKELDFPTLIRILLRRLTSVYTWYTQKDLTFRCQEVIDQANSIKTSTASFSPWNWERYSSHHNTYIDLTGIVGTVTFEGELKPFYPLLVMGTYLHIGYGPAFGMGQYSMEILY